jgi:membrane protease YdiL (CAAX protease family)
MSEETGSSGEARAAEVSSGYSAPELEEERVPGDLPPSVHEPMGQMELFVAPIVDSEREPASWLDPYVEPPPLPPLPIRHPNLADSLILLLMFLLGSLVSSGGLAVAGRLHLFGLRDMGQVKDSTHAALVILLVVYVVGLGLAMPLLRAAWGHGFFAGVHWNAATAWRLRYRLAFVAVLGNVLALVGNQFLPFPKEAPIDKMFDTPLDAWMLFAFGVTVAPFFEEMIFRGFLLPTMATSWDWCRERLTGARPNALDAAGNPVWSWPAMIFGALTVSVPFAWMHGAQVGNSWGPLILLYCVSLILCAVRLGTRSLAASTLVHSTYNFILFAMMLVGTDGFRHMDKS